MSFLSSLFGNKDDDTPDTLKDGGKVNKKQAFADAVGVNNIPQKVQRFDAGGAVPPPQAMTIGNGGQAIGSLANPVTGLTTNLNPVNGLQNAGQAMVGVASDFTAQNQYQAQLAPTDYTNYQNAIQQSLGNTQSGYNTSQGILAQQQGLANQIQGVANGTGPNPAMAQLAQNTGQNVASQAALMAGQRGSGANVGLMARQAAQQGAATQQQAVGQAATLGAQQQINAMNALANQQQSMANTNLNQQQLQSGLFGTAGSLQNAQNANTIQNYANMQGINSQVAQNNTNAVNKTQSGLMGGASSLLSMLSSGGKVHKYADGTPDAPIAGDDSEDLPLPQDVDSGNTVSQASATVPDSAATNNNLFSKFGEGFIRGYTGNNYTPPAGTQQKPQGIGSGLKTVFTKMTGDAGKNNGLLTQHTDAASGNNSGSGPNGMPNSQDWYTYSGGPGTTLSDQNAAMSQGPGYAKGGKVPALVSPGEKYLTPGQAKKVAKGKASPMIGKTVPGKAKVRGDSHKNDTVPATLEEGGVVIPRSVMTSPDAEGHAARFVASVMKGSALKGKKSK